MKRIFGGAAIVNVLCVATLFAQAPRTISYQGLVAEAGGSVLADGSYEVAFALYETSTGGTPVWTESHEVTIYDGVLSVLLGSGSPLTIPFDRPYWLGVAIGDGSELEPRIELAAVPYSLSAQSVADSVVTAAKIAESTVVRSLNSLTENVRLVAGENVSISQDGYDLVIAAQSNGTGGGDISGAWKLSGNTGTDPTTDFLGTTDAAALELRVNSMRVLRLEPATAGPAASDGPNIIGGAANNFAAQGIVGATIAGGGDPDFDVCGPSRVTGDYGAIGGGRGHRVEAGWATIAGGDCNSALEDFAFVGGGSINSAGGSLSVAVGGQNNRADGNSSVVGGGAFNVALSDHAVVSGGRSNEASGRFSTISGGGPSDEENAAQTKSQAVAAYATVGGGGGNGSWNNWSTVAGGFENDAGADDGDPFTQHSQTVGGGNNNAAVDIATAVAGGSQNMACGGWSSIGGGSNNRTGSCDSATADQYSVVAGGSGNVADGLAVSVVGGKGNEVTADYGTIGGGAGNTILSDHGTIGGGEGNVIHTGQVDGLDFSTIAGGRRNRVNGLASTISGGSGNTVGYTDGAGIGWSTISGGSGNNVEAFYGAVPGGLSNDVFGRYGFAAGRNAAANHEGSFVWSSSSDSVFTTALNQFLIDASGGVGIGTNTPSSALTVSGTIESTSGGFRFPDGTVQTTASFGGGAGDGHSLDGSTGAPTDAVFVNGLGDVGIGTTTPSSRLHIVDDLPTLTLEGSQSNKGISFRQGAQEQASLLYSNGYGLRAYIAGSIVSKTLVLSTSGDVGVGIPIPEERLHVLDADGSSLIKLGGQQTAGPHGVVFDDDTPDEGVQLVWRTVPNQLILEKTSAGSGSDGPDVFRYDRDNDTFFLGGDTGIQNASPGHPLHVGTNTSNGNGAHVTAGGVWTNGSSRSFKEDFRKIDRFGILEKLADLPVSSWSYKGEDESRHIGPVAEDFHAAFELGGDDRYIGTVDADGITMAAIQGLYELVQQQTLEIAELKRQLHDLQSAR